MKNFPSSLRQARGLGFAVLVFLCAGGSAVAESSKGASIPSDPPVVMARAIVHGDSVCVKGTVRRMLGHSFSHSAHVDVELRDAAGKVIASHHSHLAPAHPRIERRRAGQYSFTARLPRPSRPGWSVRVVCHADVHS
jgi:hypothetical protein